MDVNSEGFSLLARRGMQFDYPQTPLMADRSGKSNEGGGRVGVENTRGDHMEGIERIEKLGYFGGPGKSLDLSSEAGPKTKKLCHNLHGVLKEGNTVSFECAATNLNGASLAMLALQDGC